MAERGGTRMMTKILSGLVGLLAGVVLTLSNGADATDGRTVDNMAGVHCSTWANGTTRQCTVDFHQDAQHLRLKMLLKGHPVAWQDYYPHWFEDRLGHVEQRILLGGVR